MMKFTLLSLFFLVVSTFFLLFGLQTKAKGRAIPILTTETEKTARPSSEKPKLVRTSENLPSQLTPYYFEDRVTLPLTLFWFHIKVYRTRETKRSYLLISLNGWCEPPYLLENKGSLGVR